MLSIREIEKKGQDKCPILIDRRCQWGNCDDEILMGSKGINIRRGDYRSGTIEAMPYLEQLIIANPIHKRNQ